MFPKLTVQLCICILVSFQWFLPFQLVLELCRGDAINNLHNIQKQLEQIHVCGAELSSTQHMVRKKQSQMGSMKKTLKTQNRKNLILISFSKTQ